MHVIGCMNSRAGACRLDGMPCDGPCGQRVSFDKELNEDVRGGLPKTRKYMSEPALTAYEFMMASKASRATMQFTTNRTVGQRKLGTGPGTMKWEGQHDKNDKDWFGRQDG